MDITRIEKEIALGVASSVRAQMLAAPTLDRCIPGMVGDAERQRLREASSDLLLAASFARAAYNAFLAASQTLGAFTRGHGG
jgi:hypothetical protein